MAMPSSYGVEKSLNSMAGFSAYENGGKGSGNFGHLGRPGFRGGSGDGTGTPVAEEEKRQRDLESLQKDADDVLTEITGPRSNYCDVNAMQESVQSILAEHAMENESILLAFEDKVRADMDLPSREEEQEKGLSYGQVLDLQMGLEGEIYSMGFGGLIKNLGKELVLQAVHDAQIAGAIRYAQGMADKPTREWAQAKDLKKFIKDMDLNDRYGASRRADEGDLGTAWSDLARELQEDFDDNREKYRTI